MKLVNDNIDAIRRRLQRDMEGSQDKEKYHVLKGAARSLLTSNIKQEKLGNPNNAKRKEKLKASFALFPELAEAYDAFQEFHHVNQEPLLMLKKNALSDWLDQYCFSSIPELEKTARSLHHWCGYIQNTWEYHRSYSVHEGLKTRLRS